MQTGPPAPLQLTGTGYLSPQREEDRPATGPQTAKVAAEVEELVGLTPLTAIGASLPPPGLLAQHAVPAAALLGEAQPPTSEQALDDGSGEAGDEASVEEALAAQDGAPSGPGEELTEGEKQEVQELKQRDREVRQHEQAHMAAAGGYARGGPSYEYTTGPDNKRYAVGGEVSIDTSKESDPEATIRKAQIIYRAAMAPAEPSGQDRQVASSAKQMEAEARQELAEQRREETAEATESEETGDATAMGAGADSAESIDGAVPGAAPSDVDARAEIPEIGTGASNVPAAATGAGSLLDLIG